MTNDDIRYLYLLKSGFGESRSCSRMQRKLSRLLLVFLSFFSCFVLLSGCGAPSLNSISDTGFYFDTVISVTLYDASREDALAHCFELADIYEAYFSDSIATSDVAQINAHPFEPVAVHEETMELIEKGIAYGDISGGKFDITVGKLSDVWDFSEDDDLGVKGDPLRKSGPLQGDNPESNPSDGKSKTGADSFSLPTSEEVNALAVGIDYHTIEIDHDAGTVTLNSDACAIDLGGIAKGYIADKMKEYLENEGITSGLINLGGNVLTINNKPDGKPYAIGIQKPFAADGAPILKLWVSDLSVVTSGTYQRYAEIDGKLYHHILDVSTGYPYDNGLSSVTVLCASSTDGDALSTTLFALGLEDGLAFAEALPDVEAVFITTENEIYYSSGFSNGEIPYENMQ
ncbi:MAG: FAD:protein FMN transferase [Lachnospiraceae bacterium]|nr:FAD:protein FMN transferase [Lachnospiraceae bacterium]